MYKKIFDDISTQQCNLSVCNLGRWNVAMQWVIYIYICVCSSLLTFSYDFSSSTDLTGDQTNDLFSCYYR